MANRHVCPYCGGTTFLTPATVTQSWKVDFDGRFLREDEHCSDVLCWPDDGNIWNCTECGGEGEIVEGNLSKRSIELCALVIRKKMGTSTNDDALEVEKIISVPKKIFGEDVVNAVLACTVLNNRGDPRFNPKNTAWAEKVKLPAGMDHVAFIRSDLCCKGIHPCYADLLATSRRKEVES